MKKKFLALITLGLLSVNTYASNFDYDAMISHQGDIDIKINFKTKSDINVNEIMTNYFLNESFQKKIDPMLYKQTITDVKRSGNKRSYKLNLTAQKKVKFINVKNTLIFNCSEVIKSKKSNLTCKLDTSHRGADGGARFHYSSYKVSCLESNSDMVCSFDLKARVKGINLFVYSRTSDRLAASGTQSYVTSLYKLYKAIDQNTGERSPNLRNDNFYKTKIRTVRSTFFESMDKNDELKVVNKRVSAKSN